MPNNDLFKSYNPKNLLISLYHYPLHSRTPEKSEAPPRQFNELNTFRKNIEEKKAGPHHQPYQAGRKKALIYQSLFFGLGVIFLLMTIFMYTQTMNWSGSLFFVNYTATKTVVCLFTFALSLVACGLAYSITTEKEAANQLIHRAESKIRHILAYKRAEFNLNKFSFGMSYKKNLAANQAFKTAFRKIKESRKITIALLEHIAHEKSLTRDEIEKLFNQALLELNDKLHIIIYDFKKELVKILG
jgi:hypothetical protein